MRMSQRWVMLCSLALVVALTAAAAAQQRRGGFGFGFGNRQQSLVSLAAQEPVQKDLGLSADAAGKLNGLNDEYRAAIQKEMQAAGQLDQAGLLTRVQSLAKEPQADIAAMIDVLQAEHRKAPLPAAAFAAVLRQLQAATDKTLLRARDAALAYIIGDTAPADTTEVLHDPAAIAQAAMSQPPPFIRTLVSRFGLAELAGEGGMSRVYKAVDLRMVEAGSEDPHVAVKVLNIPFENVNDAMALLHREMRHLQDLVHPNIVRVFDCDRDGDTVFMTMEFLAGRTLTTTTSVRGSPSAAMIARMSEARLATISRARWSALVFMASLRSEEGPPPRERHP